ncbi:MAG: mechanosensitive ion channel family protein [Saprospiraceae bacterium]
MLDFILDTNTIEFLVIAIGTLILAYTIDVFFNRFLVKSAKLMNNDPTKYKFLRHFLRAIIYITGFAWAISEVPYLKSVSSSLLAGAGVLAVAVGFASQQALSNIVSGLFIIIFKPFRINDRLKLNKDHLLQGVVEDITLRHTVIRDFENRRIIVPNSVISQEIIINADFTEDKIIKFVDINVSLTADLQKAKTIMRAEVLAHPLQVDPRSEEEQKNGTEKVPVRVIALGEYYVTVRAWACAKNAPDAFELYCDLLESIKYRFDHEGVEIPVPQRNIHKSY